MKIALDQAHAVEVLIDHRQVDGVGLKGLSRGGVQVRSLRVDQRLPPSRGLDLSHAPEGARPVLVGELLGLDHQVQCFG